MKTERDRKEHDQAKKPAEKNSVTPAVAGENAGGPVDSRENPEGAEKIRDRLLRLQAEFENYRKRVEKEKTDFVKFANAGLLLELIQLLDHFERAVAAAEKSRDFDSLLQGVKMVQEEMTAALKKKGLERMKTAGEIFDPHRHEAVAPVITDEQPENTVVDELRKGYLLEGKVIRPAVVRVAKKSGEAGPKPSAKSEEKDSP